MNHFDEKIHKNTKFAFATAEIGDNVAYQSFSFLVFTFYFTSVKLPVQWISLGFIIWSIWNSINDPLLGFLSDKTQSRFGRRIPWMIGVTIPLAISMVLLFTPPNTDVVVVKFLYFLLMIFIFDLCYTSFNINYNSMFSEMFISMEERAKVGQTRIMFVILGLILAFVIPTLVIEDVTNKFSHEYTQSQFITNGIITGGIILIAYFIVLRWGVRNTSLFSKDAGKSLPFRASLKETFKNKSFLIYIIPGLGTWIVIGILPAVIPLWATYVLKITQENSILTGVLLLMAFLMAGLSTPLWAQIRQKKGARAAGLWGIGSWTATILLFLIGRDFITGLIAMIVVGFGLGGGLYFYDQCLAEIIDEDEVTQGIRRPGMYYGIINFIIRLSGIINYLMIGIVFSGSDWETYTPNPGIDTLEGLQFLISWYPFIVLVISLIGLYFYPIKGKKLEEIREKMTILHQEKLKNTTSS